MGETLLAHPASRLVVALAVGLLIGIERERRKGEGIRRGAAGLRTFALFGLLGGVATQSGLPVLLPVAASFTALAALLSYWLGDRSDPGFTTEVALLVTFFLGVLAQTQPELSIGTAVVVTFLLAIKAPLHRLVRETLSDRELSDGLIFSIAALVVLPVLPHRAIDPFGLFNPFTVWRLVVVLMALSAAGYVAVRVVGPRYGFSIAGFASGFISSTAAIAAMGGRARENHQLAVPCAGGAVASILGSLVYLSVLVAAADLNVMSVLMKPLLLALVATLIYSAVLSGLARKDEPSETQTGHAFDFTTIVAFSLLVAIFTLISTGIVLWLGEAGVLGGAAITGLIDVHAASVSLATLIASGKVDADFGALGILIALTANMLSKIPASFALGPRAFSARVAIGLALLLCGLWAGYGWNAIGQ